MSNYYKLKDQAPNYSIYMKVDGKMVFLPFWEIPSVKLMLDKIESQEKQITELQDLFRLVEQKLRQKGVRL